MPGRARPGRSCPRRCVPRRRSRSSRDRRSGNSSPRAWDAVQDGGRHAVFVRGQPGAGKTRLATEFARHAAANGGTVLFGSCREGGGPPFGPVVDALEHLLAHADAVGIADVDAERARSLLRTEPEEDSGPGLTFGQDPRAARFQAATDLLVDAGGARAGAVPARRSAVGGPADTPAPAALAPHRGAAAVLLRRDAPRGTRRCKRRVR